jgi:ubiquinone biosynthesis protein COQ4
VVANLGPSRTTYRREEEDMEQIAKLISQAYGRPIDMSVLTENSPYLKHDKLREWMGFLMLRRLGDLEMSNPVAFATIHMRMVREMLDHDRINALFAQERRRNPAVDKWFAQKHVSTYTAEDLAAYPEGSFGGVFHRYVVQCGYELDLGINLPLDTDFDYWVVRGLQNHDLEHLLGGGGFNAIGEMIPASTRWGSLFRHFDPELAGLLNIPTFLLFQAELASAMLHTPEVFPTLFGRMQRGWLIGQTSGPYFMARIEDVFHLPLAEARKALEINNVDDADTTAMSDFMMGARRAA